MAIPVVPVTCVAHTQDGAAITGARFTFTLTNTEVYGGFVVPRRFEGTTDDTGTAVINVFPNELGMKESMYTVVGVDNQGRRFLDGRAVIPAAACNLTDVVDLAAYANFDLAMQAKLDAQASAADAQAQSSAAAASALSASGSASSASASALSATASAGTATTQAATATTQAGIATTQAGIATTQAAEALASASLASASNALRNKILNANFAGNTRQVSGSIVLTAGAFGHDMWLAGAAGCSLSVTAGLATITAGAYKTVVDGASIGPTGNHVLSWTGTAQASVNGGASQSSPIVISLTAGANVSIQFGIGTLGMPQLERGTVATAAVQLPPELQRFALNYYVKNEYVLIGGSNSRLWLSARSSSSVFRAETSVGSMRVVPSVTLQNNTSVEYLNASSVWTATSITGSCYGLPSSLLFLASAPADATGTGVFVRRSVAGDVIAVLSAELT